MKIDRDIPAELIADQAIMRLRISQYRGAMMQLPPRQLADLARQLLDPHTTRMDLYQRLAGETDAISLSSWYRFADEFEAAAKAVHAELIPHLLCPPLLTPDRVASWLRLDPAKVDQLIASGKLPAIRVGGELRLDRRDVREYLAAHGQRRDSRGRYQGPAESGFPRIRKGRRAAPSADP